MNILKLYDRLQQYPLGKTLFTKAVCRQAPYFSTIRPLISSLRTNYCEVRIKKRRSVTNHINTVHAIAMCNMAELAGGLMTDVSIPRGARWIPSGMTVQYLKKAKTDLTAIADASGIDFTVTGDVVVPVDVKDTSGDIVFHADITMNVKQAT
ncbi:MAG: hotdog fold domain-containing protein [Pseudomonadota bacterium]